METNKELIEAAAKAIYRLMPSDRTGGPDNYPWQDGGNSHMQDLARRYADAALAQRVVSEAVPVDSTCPTCSAPVSVSATKGGKAITISPDTAAIYAAQGYEVSYTAPPAAPVAWDADATTRLRSIVAMLGLTDSVPDGDLTGHEFAVLGFVRRAIERMKAPTDAKPSAWIIKYPDGVVIPLIGETVPKVYEPFATPLFAAATKPTGADRRDAALKIARSALVSVVYSNASNKLIQKSDAAINTIDAAIAASAKEAK